MVLVLFTSVYVIVVSILILSIVTENESGYISSDEKSTVNYDKLLTLLNSNVPSENNKHVQDEAQEKDPLVALILLKGNNTKTTDGLFHELYNGPKGPRKTSALKINNSVKQYYIIDLGSSDEITEDELEQTKVGTESDKEESSVDKKKIDDLNTKELKYTERHGCTGDLVNRCIVACKNALWNVVKEEQLKWNWSKPVSMYGRCINYCKQRMFD